MIILVIGIISTILVQFKKSKVRDYDFLGLLPSFRFFAPRPVTRDLKIYAQAFDTNGNESSWKELFISEKKWYCFIWNPQHRLRKTVIDIYSDLDEFREAKDIWHLSYPYLILLYASTFLFNANNQYKSVQLILNHKYQKRPISFELQIYRIIKDFLSNVIKHAKASIMYIHIRDTDKTLSVILSDNGKGFSTDLLQKGMGLKNIETRIQSINAHSKWKSKKNNGSQLIIALPKQ